MPINGESPTALSSHSTYYYKSGLVLYPTHITFFVHYTYDCIRLTCTTRCCALIDWVGCATNEACATQCVENYMDRYGTYCTGKPDNQVSTTNLLHWQTRQPGQYYWQCTGKPENQVSTTNLLHGKTRQPGEYHEPTALASPTTR